MTSKERAELRGKANKLQPLFQVGKGGINEALIQQTDDALRANELIKLRVLLETSPKTPKEVAYEIATATGAEVVGVIGGSMVFYRYSQELHDKEKQKKANIKAVKKSIAKKNKESKNRRQNIQDRTERKSLQDRKERLESKERREKRDKNYGKNR